MSVRVTITVEDSRNMLTIERQGRPTTLGHEAEEVREVLNEATEAVHRFFYKETADDKR